MSRLSRNTRLLSPPDVDAWRRRSRSRKRRKVDHLLQENDHFYYRDREEEQAGPPSRTRSRLKKKLQLLQDHQEQPDLPQPIMITHVKPKPLGRRKKLNHEDVHHSTRKEKPSHDKAKKSPRTDVHPTCTSQPSVSSSLLQPLPEKRILELILDTLQRRDTYEIFAEPVDPEEVEDYYEIVKEPMDFGTMRAKLHEGMYTNLEQFEHDAFLISGNAMHFNSSATIFFRQARAIHELSKKVFNVLKTDPENFVMEFSGTRRRSSQRLQGEAKNLSCRPATRNSSNARANASSRGSSCSFIGPSSMRKSIIGNLGVAGTTTSGRDLGFIFGAQNGIKCSSNEVDRRCTYKPKVFLDHDSVSFASRIHIDPKPLVLVNQQDIGYSESLMRFVKDLGPTAKMIAERKVRGLSGDSPTYDHQPPTAQISAPFSFMQPMPSSSSDHQSIIFPILSHKLLNPGPPAGPSALKSRENIIDLSHAEDGESKVIRGRDSNVALGNKRLGRVNFEDSRRSELEACDHIQLKGIDEELGCNIYGMNILMRDGELVSSVSGGINKRQVSSSKCKTAVDSSEKSRTVSEVLNSWNKKMIKNSLMRNIIGSKKQSWDSNYSTTQDPAAAAAAAMKSSSNPMELGGSEVVVLKEAEEEGAISSRFTFDLPFLKSQLSQMKFYRATGGPPAGTGT